MRIASWEKAKSILDLCVSSSSSRYASRFALLLSLLLPSHQEKAMGHEGGRLLLWPRRTGFFHTGTCLIIEHIHRALPSNPLPHTPWHRHELAGRPRTALVRLKRHTGTMMRAFLCVLPLLATAATAATSTAFQPPVSSASKRTHPFSAAAAARRQQRLQRQPSPELKRAPLQAAASSSSGSLSDLQAWTKKWQAEQHQDVGPTSKATTFHHASLAEVLAEVFDQVLKAEKAEKGVPPPQHLLLFPDAESLYDGHLMRQFGDHLDLCKECCEVMGLSQNTIVMHPSTASPALQCPVPAVLIKGIAQTSEEFSDDDPYWNDDDDAGFDFSALYNDDDESAGAAAARELEKLYVVPEEDEPIMVGMKGWVDAIIADLGVCPFTVNAAKAGLPQGAIRYDIDRSVSPEEIYRKYWQEVALISKDSKETQDERSLSTTLLITPNFGLRNREFFETFSNTLTQPLEALGLEEEIQLVFFHPEWVFRDGADRMGQDDAANYARRSPWPMINILRTPQVRKAQKAIPTGLVYRQNEVTLDKIGSGRLRRWLVERDWGEVKDNFRVDRKTVPILSTAQDLLLGLTPEALSEDMVAVAPPALDAAVRAATAKEEEAEEEQQQLQRMMADEEGEEDEDGEEGEIDVGEKESVASASAAAYSAAAAAKAAAANRRFFGGGFEDEFGGAGEAAAAAAAAQEEEEDDEDDWDKPLKESQMFLEIENDPTRVKRPIGEIIQDSKAVLALLRKRLAQSVPLSPAEVHEFEERAKRMRKD